MKNQFLLQASAVLSLAAVAFPSSAHSYRPDLLGDAAAVSPSYKTIQIRPDTKYINVNGDETVNFVVDGKSFAWRFPIGNFVTTFDLNQVAPPGMLDHTVRAYIAPDPAYKQE
jgi:hypothetical protein